MFSEITTKKAGQSIAKLRNHRNIKAEEIAKHLHITSSAYTKYERGETPITIIFLNIVAKFFDVDPIHFLVNGPENVVENIHNSAVTLNNHNNTNNVINSIDRDLLLALQNQMMEKDKQIKKLLDIIEGDVKKN